MEETGGSFAAVEETGSTAPPNRYNSLRCCCEDQLRNERVMRREIGIEAEEETAPEAEADTETRHRHLHAGGEVLARNDPTTAVTTLIAGSLSTAT